MTPDNDVLILGCGPAGLLAAYAVERAGGSPVIYSRKAKSTLPGAQYLHEPIPGLHDRSEPDGVIRTIRRGTPEVYAAKVYGSCDAPTSWDPVHHPRREEECAAWDLRATYDLLWDRYASRIEDTDIRREALGDLTSAFPLVISTIWAPQLCSYRGLGLHTFAHETMYVVDWAPEEVEDNTVVYSGEPETEWYRQSRVFGHASSEATPHCLNTGGISYTRSSAAEEPLTLPLRKGIKVVGSNCDCSPDIKRAGRYGTWRKGYLTHHAFEDATDHYKTRFGA